MSKEEKTEPEEASEQPKSGGKKLLIIGLAAGILIGGGVGAGAFFMLGNSPKETEEVHAEPEPVAHEPEVEAFFVKLERVNLPIIHNDRTLGSLTVEFSLEVASNEDKMTVIRNLPEIRDAMLRHYSVTPIGKATSPKSIDYDRLKETLKDISNNILHHPLVTKVMVVQVRQF